MTGEGLGTVVSFPPSASSNPALAVHDKWSGALVGTVPTATADGIEQAVSRGRAAAATDWSPRDRAAALARAATLLSGRAPELVATMVAETGFTVADVQSELARARVTLELCAQEATRLVGDGVSLDASGGFDRYLAFTVRVPIGLVAAITPFNSPLNGVCHKVGPALAAGNAVILKPAELAPLIGQAMVDLLHEAGVPEDRLQVLHGTGIDAGLPLVRDARVDFITFTGSTAVGEIIRGASGVTPLQLELGSISPTIVAADAVLEQAATLLVAGAFRKAGQVCTSVQRVLAHDDIVEPLTALIAEKAGRLHCGDPGVPGTDVGPVISSEAADRIQRLVADSCDHGARIVAGGSRDDRLITPTVLVDVDEDSPFTRAEVFGPVLGITPVISVDDAIERVNGGAFGLQSGVFSSSIATALQCARRLQTGAVVINGTSSTRADAMPFGGQKSSGYGKEGPAHAMREMSVQRTLLLGPES